MKQEGRAWFRNSVNPFYFLFISSYFVYDLDFLDYKKIQKRFNENIKKKKNARNYRDIKILLLLMVNNDFCRLSFFFGTIIATMSSKNEYI